MLNTIKKVAAQTSQAAVPVKLMYGEVQTAAPLTVRVEARFTLDADALVVLQDAAPLAAGDKVVLLRDHGGQAFLVLGRVG